MAVDNSQADKGKKSVTPNPDDDNSQGDTQNDNQDADKKGKKSDDSADDERKFSQKDIGKFIAAARKEARDQAQRDQQEEEQRRKGEFQALNQTLTTERDTLRKELDDLKESNKLQAEAFVALINAEIKALPDSIADLKPESDDPLVIAGWLKKAKKSARALAEKGGGEEGDEAKPDDKKPAGDKKPGVTGGTGNPKPATKSATDKEQEARAVEQHLLAERSYGF